MTKASDANLPKFGQYTLTIRITPDDNLPKSFVELINYDGYKLRSDEIASIIELINKL